MRLRITIAGEYGEEYFLIGDLPGHGLCEFDYKRFVMDAMYAAYRGMHCRRGRTRVIHSDYEFRKVGYYTGNGHATVILALALALGLFLSEYLLYRYDW